VNSFEVEDKNLKSIKLVKCLQCSKEFIPKYKNNRFCSCSCAAKYNNVRRDPVSEETKTKTSETLLKRYHGENWREEIKMFKEIISNKGGKKHKRYFLDQTPNNICKICGKKFFSCDKNAIYCSNKCKYNDAEFIKKIRDKQLENVRNGVHKGWQSRNIESYPEKFWKKVLNENSIGYKREDFSTKKYFLDFLIEKNGKKIDLEIDGKQHNYRKEHDIIRDKFLSENGFIVYRVDWNSINDEKGKEEMKHKINDFIEFYHNL